MANHKKQIEEMLARIQAIPLETDIPNPETDDSYTISKWDYSNRKCFGGKHWSMIYRTPKGHGGPIPLPVFKWACEDLINIGRFTRKVYDEKYPGAHSCTFTTLGGVFEYLDEAEYGGYRSGFYRRKKK